MSISDFDDGNDQEGRAKYPASRDGQDKALSFHWRAIHNEWIEGLQLPPAPSMKHEKARASVLVDAYRNARLDPEQFISYSRRKEFYAAQSRYQGTHYAFSTVPWAVDNLTTLGWLDHDRARPGDIGMQSAFRAKRALLEAVALPQIVLVYDEPILLNDREGRPMAYERSPTIDAMRTNARTINEAVRSAALRPGSGESAGELWRFTKHNGERVDVDPAHDQLQRIFHNGKWNHGGRYYRGWWLSAPRADREKFTIDGEPVAEPDYRGCHATLLYAKVGKRPPSEPYSAPGWEHARDAVKRAFFIMLNVETDAAGLRAIVHHVIGGPGAYAKARDLMMAIKRVHAPVADFFCSGAGLWLMRVDSDMAEHVLLKSLKDGIVAFPVHDSFIVKAHQQGRLREVMQEAQLRASRKLNPEAFPVLQAAGDGFPPMVLMIPEGRQLDLLREIDPITVPVAELHAWRGGVMPKAVRAGLRHMRARQGIRQAEMAAVLGISRPQLANAEQGRFGLGPEAAERVKAMIEGGAA